MQLLPWLLLVAELTVVGGHKIGTILLSKPTEQLTGSSWKPSDGNGKKRLLAGFLGFMLSPSHERKSDK